MKNQETGEFELVLGNKQLLSGFFIVVILFGVFFVMGYIVGRNSSPASRVAAANSLNTAPAPATTAVDTRTQAPETPTPEQPKPPETAVQTEAHPAVPQPQPQPFTQAAREPEAAPPAPPAPPAEAGTTAVAQPTPGEVYLQVTALKRQDAEIVAKSLREKGFKVILAPAPGGDEKLRVLVGPFPDAASLGPTKAQIENLGFHNTFVRK